MPGALSDLINLLKGNREGILASVQGFPPLDIDQLAKDINLQTRGAENGERNQPEPTSDVEDAAEGDIAAEIEHRARKAGEDYRAQLDLYDVRIRRATDTLDQRAAINAAAESALADFRVQATDDLDHLHSSLREVEGRRQEYQDFRRANRLQRLPNIVSRPERIARLLILAIAVVIEAILNGSFFAKGSETGLIGGFMQAVVLSLLNIGAAIGYAKYGLPMLLHVRRTIKITGVTLTLLYVSWLIFLNLAIGQFRELFVQNAGQVSMAELSLRLWAAPFVFSEARSGLLVILGIALSVVCVIDASGMDDPYMGYGAVGRRQQEAVTRYADQKARCMAGLTQRRNQAVEELNSLIRVIQSASSDMRLAADGRRRLHREYCAYLTHLGDCYRRLLRRYREANARARSSPVPPRFDREPQQLPCLAVPAELVPSDDPSENHQASLRLLEDFVKAINREFEKAVQRFQTVTDVMEPSERSNVTA